MNRKPNKVITYKPPVYALMAIPWHKVRPLGHRYLIRPDAPERVYAGRIIIPDGCVERSTSGIVLRAGPGRWDEEAEAVLPMSCRVGDRVHFPVLANVRSIEIGGEELLLLEEDHLLAVESGVAWETVCDACKEVVVVEDYHAICPACDRGVYANGIPF